MGTRLLHETTNTRLESKGARWKATLVTPGQGSSGFYSEEMLERSIDAFTGGGRVPAKNYFMHPAKPGDQRDPRDQWGYIEPSSVKYERGVGLTGEINVLPHWKSVIESLANAGQAALSIYAMGESDEDGNVTALLPHLTNSVDLVDYPGREGSGLTTQIESARAAYKPAAASAEEKEARHMDPKDLEAIKNAFVEALKPVVDFVTEQKGASDKAHQAEADAEAVERGVEAGIAAYEEKVGAIDATEGLSAKQVESLKSAAKRGEDITESLAEAKAIADDFKTLHESAGASNSGGFVTESHKSKTDDDDFTIANWS